MQREVPKSSAGHDLKDILQLKEIVIHEHPWVKIGDEERPV